MKPWNFEIPENEPSLEDNEEVIIEAHLEEPDEIWDLPPELEPEIQDLPYADDIMAIENQILREEEAEKVAEITKELKDLDHRVESGRMDPEIYKMERLNGRLTKKMNQAATRIGMAAEGLTMDHLIDLGEDYDSLVTGDHETPDLKAKVRRSISELGSDHAQDWADRMLKDGEITKEAHETISRQVRLARLDRK